MLKITTIGHFIRSYTKFKILYTYRLQNIKLTKTIIFFITNVLININKVLPAIKIHIVKIATFLLVCMHFI